MNAEGAFAINYSVPLRKINFNKLRDKEIPVKPEHIKKIEASVREMK